MNYIKKKKISRRFVLRGTGVALGLPLLDAMVPAFVKNGFAQGLKTPKNFLGIYFPFGTMSAGDRVNHYHLGGDLRVLQTLFNQKRIAIFNGIHQAGGDIHAASTFLTANTSNRNDPDTVKNESFDVMLSRRMPEAIRSSQPLWTLGVRHAEVGGFRTHISWRGPRNFVPKELNLQRVYNNLVRGSGNVDRSQQLQFQYNARLSYNAVDNALEQANLLRRTLGAQDRIRLESYLEGLRSLERRLKAETELQPPKALPDYRPPSIGARDELRLEPFTQKSKAMIEMSLIAMSVGVTHVSTLNLDHAQGGLNFEDGYSYHNAIAHGTTDSGSLREAKAKVHRMVAELMRFATQKAIDLGIWEDTVIILGTECSRHHNPADTTVLAAGGVWREYLGTQNSYNKPMGSLLLTVAQRFGLEIDRFGLSWGTL